MSETAETVENAEYLKALTEITDKIKKANDGESEDWKLRMGTNILHELIFSPGKEPLHRLIWTVKKN